MSGSIELGFTVLGSIALVSVLLAIVMTYGKKFYLEDQEKENKKHSKT